MFGNIDNKYPILLECELVQYEGGGGKWEIHVEAHKVVDSVGKWFSSIYKAGQGFGKNWYNANN
ncbi:bacteriocin leader domain-containing protein [Streptococcus suis]|uniref:bacteriocin leader domain-containing protein n=1 Tax=Streptococcus suis TaxID=1307 RepID=UPI001C95C9C0|nr:bacteriocin leader domain-containing protein [Streptococcus suis]MBY4978380.1 bacteriocin leader domain-containing protein [Streptococcus suis]MBY4978397.1 bacteriocin leader domain-containing protein [Streptococcus suis]UMW89012.1 hypothetical protein [Streptococcus suis]